MIALAGSFFTPSGAITGLTMANRPDRPELPEQTRAAAPATTSAAVRTAPGARCGPCIDAAAFSREEE